MSTNQIFDLLFEDIEEETALIIEKENLFSFDSFIWGHFAYPRTCAYQGLRNIRFWENLTCFVLLKDPFWDSSFCLITDEIQELSFLSQEKAIDSVEKRTTNYTK